MRYLLRLTHWQLFLATTGSLTLAETLGDADSRLGKTIEITAGLMAVGILFGWIWAITNCLHSKLPNPKEMKLWIFRPLFFMALTILVLMLWLFKFNQSTTQNELPVALLLLAAVTYLALMAFTVLFAAKTLKSVEMSRSTTIDEYGDYAFLIWMIPIGVWFLQPRLNKLTDKETLTGSTTTSGHSKSN